MSQNAVLEWSGESEAPAVARKQRPLSTLLLLVLLGVASSARAGGLSTSPVGRLSGELVVVGEDGARLVVVHAATDYTASSGSGTATINIRQVDTRLAHATADFTAETGGAALGGVTALALA